MPAGGSQEPGTSVRAVVLDVSKKDGIVDLSLQPALVQRAAAAAAEQQQQGQQQPKKKKQKPGAAGEGDAPAAAAAQLREGQQVEASIELVRPGMMGSRAVCCELPDCSGTTRLRGGALHASQFSPGRLACTS